MKHALTSLFLFGLSSLCPFAPLSAQQEQGKPGEGAAAPEAEPEAADLTLEQRLAGYEPVKGTVKVGKWAEVKLEPGWLFLAGRNAQRFLEDVGNERDPSVLGVAFPADYDEARMFAVYSYADEGHVEDDENPDFGALLADMKESTKAGSKERKKAGLQSVELLGWAEPPHYDKAQHKLYWAEKLQFEGEDGPTLNYNVRILGRTGHLVVQGVGGIDQLPLVAARSKDLLGVTEFVEGQRYENFDPAYDKVAAYGIGGLIAGKLALKAGLFAKLGILLAKFLKPLLIGLAVLGGAIAKVFTGRKKAEPEGGDAA
ncbi:MAG: DUF2167 domain-containing protein [Planctomycetes bacterium]|nr:DUF2167 domain-containing protein [Planctomycetota bacterium]